MKISTCTVSCRGYAQVTGNDHRLDLLEQSLKEQEKKNVKFATYPGGFLSCKSEKQVRILAKKIQELSTKYGIYIALGIDAKNKSTKEDDKLIQKYSLPWFAAVASPKSEVKVWRQRSSDSKNYKFVSPEVASERRTIKIKNKTIEILICGEIFSPTIKSSLISRNINVAIDLGHTSQGFRVALAMQVLAENGVNAYCSVHAEKMNAMKHGFIPNGANVFKKISSRTYDILIRDNPRIEIKTWKI